MSSFISAVLLCLFCAFCVANTQRIKCLCTADIRNGSITGTVAFYDLIRENKYRVNGVIYGLTPGLHGFHIHERPDLSDSCNAAGPHYNPNSESHGCHHTREKHAGDLGNIYANRHGVASFSLTFNGQLTYPHHLCERSIVVHADPDDCGKGDFADSRTTGHSGQRIACAVMQLQRCKQLYYSSVDI